MVTKYQISFFHIFYSGPTGLGGARLQERKKPVKLISAARNEAVCSVARTFWLLMQSSEAAAAAPPAATHAPPWSSLRPCRTPRLCTTIAGKSKFCPKIMRPFSSYNREIRFKKGLFQDEMVNTSVLIKVVRVCIIFF